MDLIGSAATTIFGTARDVLPVALFLILFHTVVLRRRLPHLGRLAAGFGFVIAGLALFLLGLEKGLFPLGRLMAEQLTADLTRDGASPARWFDYHWIYLFAFATGFGTTIAEPALLAVAIKANEVSGGVVHIWGFRVAVALGVAIGVTLGCIRIVTGTPIHWYIICGYLLVIIQTVFAPRLFVPLAYDSGGVTTSTVTVPLITALGLGLAEAVPGRSPLLDGFGLIAFASLFSVISVLGFVQLTQLWIGRVERSTSQNAKPTSIEAATGD